VVTSSELRDCADAGMAAISTPHTTKTPSTQAMAAMRIATGINATAKCGAATHTCAGWADSNSGVR
jgi:hypothetical protein